MSQLRCQSHPLQSLFCSGHLIAQSDFFSCMTLMSGQLLLLQPWPDRCSTTADAFSFLYLDEPTVFSGRAASAPTSVADASPFSTVGGTLAPVNPLASLFAGRL